MAPVLPTLKVKPKVGRPKRHDRFSDNSEEIFCAALLQLRKWYHAGVKGRGGSLTYAEGVALIHDTIAPNLSLDLTHATRTSLTSFLQRRTSVEEFVADLRSRELGYKVSPKSIQAARDRAARLLKQQGYKKGSPEELGFQIEIYSLNGDYHDPQKLPPPDKSRYKASRRK